MKLASTSRYGRTNFGTKGYSRFFATHRCNFICKSLSLNRHPLHPSDEFTSPFERAYRKLEDEGPCEINCTAMGCSQIVELTTDGAKSKPKSDILCNVCTEKMSAKEKAVCDEPGCSATFEYQPYKYTAKGMHTPKVGKDIILPFSHSYLWFLFFSFSFAILFIS